jgi:archaellum component FlaC
MLIVIIYTVIIMVDVILSLWILYILEKLTESTRAGSKKIKNNAPKYINGEDVMTKISATLEVIEDSFKKIQGSVENIKGDIATLLEKIEEQKANAVTPEDEEKLNELTKLAENIVAETENIAAVVPENTEEVPADETPAEPTDPESKS